MATKPVFRSALKKRRCLVVADGYYEWQAQGKLKQPYLYELDDGKSFAFAGLWEQWWDAAQKATEPLQSCTIITAVHALNSGVRPLDG